MATIRILARRSSFRQRFNGLSCEIVSDLCPNPFSHDWHVQPNCQRPNRTPPERRAFSPAGDTQVRLRPSSKPYKHTVLRQTLSTQASHNISTGFPHRENSGGPTRSDIKMQQWKSGPSGPRQDSTSLVGFSPWGLRRATVWIFRLASA